jgi:hypothetical protein
VRFGLCLVTAHNMAVFGIDQMGPQTGDTMHRFIAVSSFDIALEPRVNVETGVGQRNIKAAIPQLTRPTRDQALICNNSGLRI